LTVEDANRRLPLLRAIVRDAMALKADVLGRQDRLLALRERYPGDETDSSPYSEEVLEMEESLEADEIRIDEFIAEVAQIDAVLVDVKQGLVEFSSLVEEQPVWLSWKFGESEVGYWRSEDEASTERKPLQPVQTTH